MNIKYQRITDIIKPLEIMDIIRDEQMEEVNVYVKTDWEYLDENNEKIVNIYIQNVSH